MGANRIGSLIATPARSSAKSNGGNRDGGGSVTRIEYIKAAWMFVRKYKPIKVSITINTRTGFLWRLCKYAVTHKRKMQ